KSGSRPSALGGITVPIVPGIVPIQTWNGFIKSTSLSQWNGFIKRTSLSQTEIPKKLLDALERYKSNDEKVREIGTKLVAEMCRWILSGPLGIKGHVHFYTMNLEKGTRMLLEELNLVPRIQTIKLLPAVEKIGRYHLYVPYACPWATRTLIMRKLKELEDFIDVSVICPHIGERGWPFHVKDLYLRAAPDYEGRFTVPILWDKQQNKSPSCASTQSTSATSSATSLCALPVRRAETTGNVSPLSTPSSFRPPCMAPAEEEAGRGRLMMLFIPCAFAALAEWCVGSDTSETIVEYFGDATTSMRTHSAYRLVPINKDAQILRFEDVE
ncbi:hypothetical protein EVJ58_g10737, partial [Rhodofomes roseus]